MKKKYARDFAIVISLCRSPRERVKVPVFSFSTCKTCFIIVILCFDARHDQILLATFFLPTLQAGRKSEHGAIHTHARTRAIQE